MVDVVALANRRAKGKRPVYFDDPALDQLWAVVLALAGEVAVNRERMDTIERLLEARGTLSRADIEAYMPDREAGLERGAQHRAFIARVLRVVEQEMQALGVDERPLEEVSAELIADTERDRQGH